QVLFGQDHRREEMLRVALVPLALEPDQRFVVLIEQQTMARPINPKLMERRAHLARKREVGGRRILVRNEHSELIHDLVLSERSEHWAHEAVGEDLRRIAHKKFRDPGYAMADDVVQESAG